MVSAKNHDAVSALEQEINVIYEAIGNIEEALKDFPGAYKRARSYWLAHIDGALMSERGLLGGSFISARDTISELLEDPEE